MVCDLGNGDVAAKVDFSHTVRADLLVLLKTIECFERFFQNLQFHDEKSLVFKLSFQVLEAKTSHRRMVSDLGNCDLGHGRALEYEKSEKGAVPRGQGILPQGHV